MVKCLHAVTSEEMRNLVQLHEEEVRSFDPDLGKSALKSMELRHTRAEQDLSHEHEKQEAIINQSITSYQLRATARMEAEVTHMNYRDRINDDAIDKRTCKPNE